MLVLRTISQQSDGPDMWRAHAKLDAGTQEVLRALTDPSMIAQWAPVSFRVDGLAGERLHAGSRERVSGSIAGVTVTFDIEVKNADTDGLDLVARGPVSLEVAYSFQERVDGVLVEAAVTVRREGGLKSQVLASAVGALLSAGALGCSLHRLENSLSRPVEHELLMAA
jgi:hypothetical protein